MNAPRRPFLAEILGVQRPALLEADVGRASVCAEAVALGAALQAVPVSSLLFGRYRRNTGVIV